MRQSISICAAAFGLLAACSSDPGVAPTLDVDVFGWQSGSGFVGGLPTFDDAQTIRVKVTKPLSKEVIKSETTPVASRSLSVPDLPFGSDLRMDFEVLNSTGTIIGAGATPRFDFTEERQLVAFRVQVTEVNAFAPIGNVVVDRETSERKFAWTQLDYRGKDGVTWLGRTGHATATASDGRVLIVGGGDPVPGTGPAALAEYRSVYDDVQVFDPETGYFSDLAFDENNGQLLVEGDRLFEPIVHHTLTAIGNDRFLVAGGYTPRNDVMRPVNTLQIIDLNAPAGSRVQRLVDSAGSSLVLQKARGFHTATYRSIDNHVVITGGVGPQGEDDVLATFEMVDLATQSVYQETFDLQEARAQHSAVLMSDGRSIWLVGGHDGTSALAATEIVGLTPAGTTESEASFPMRTARFGLAALNVSVGTGDLLLVAGGFTNFDGDADDSFEVGRLGADEFKTGTNWTLENARGGLRAVELPQTNNVLLLGGRDSGGDIVATAEVLEFADLGTDPPYSVTETAAGATPRYAPSLNLLSSGRVLLVGGVGEVNNAEAGLDTADMFNPMDPVGGATVVVTE